MKSLLNISDLSQNDFDSILHFADDLDNQTEKILTNKNIGLIFEKNSTRTRLSFQVGINQLDGNYIDVRFEELNLNRFESYEDTFEVMSCYLDYLVFRTTDHKKLELANKFFKKPIINALSDLSHPCQAISDLYTLKENFGSINNLNIVWMGDMNNVLFSLLEAISFTKNTKVDVFTDEAIYSLNKDNFNLNKNINFHFNINEEIIAKANCIMTDVFTSMNDKEDKENLLSKFKVNNDIMSLTDKKSVFMHCLPAKIGSEVSEDVIKGEKSIVLSQAKNRLVAQKGILKWLSI
ncbi:ornithine carbamoyltransferase [Alphaproteobacteria bacterium]|nr:ornithine carbamoyltransferase [Alphaproteobacteria bacterium]